MKQEERLKLLAACAQRLIGAYQLANLLVLEKPELEEFAFACMCQLIDKAEDICEMHGCSDVQIKGMLHMCELAIESADSAFSVAIGKLSSGGSA